MAHRRLWRSFLLPILTSLLLAACQSTPAPEAGRQDDDGDKKEKAAKKELQEKPKDPTVEAKDEVWKKRLQDLAKQKEIARQQDVAESAEYYRRGLQAFERGRFQDARTFCRIAVKKNPENLQARQLLAKVESVIVGEGFGVEQEKDARVKVIKVRIQAAQVEITNHIRNGERFYNAGMYTEAIQEFEEAAFKIKHIPFDVPAMKKLEPLVLAHVRKSREAKKLEEERVRDMKRKEAEREAYAHEVATKREVTKKIAHLLELAYMAFDQKKYGQCVKLSNEILLIDPHYSVAKEIREDAEKARHRWEYYKFIKKKVDAWKMLTNSDDEATIPYSESVRWPSRDEWAEISKRMTESVIKTQDGTAAEDPEILAIQNTIEKTRIAGTLAFEKETLPNILKFLRELTQLNIIPDGSIDAAILEKQISFKVKDVLLKNALRLLLSQFGLDYTIRPERVVWITTPDKAGGRPIPELHDIRDILVKIQDYPGPKVELAAPGQGGQALTGVTVSLEEPKESAVGQDQIVDLIKENIAPKTWGEGSYEIQLTPNQTLLVNHTPKVQQQIREFLAKLRSYTGTMVSVTARFVAAFDDFLDDVGVDIINRNANNPGFLNAAGAFDVPGTGTTDMDDPSAQIGPGFVTNESARLEAYDLRAQTFHNLLQTDPLTGIGLDPLSNRLVNQGGLGMQYQFIGEQALQLVLRALHKGQKATLVQAPNITVFNTQRSHIMLLTQIAYIQDLDPQISTLAAAYDPQIGVLTQGVVLDVRPIVSNDRKYVTLELRPSLAQLQFLRAIDINTGQPVGQGQVATTIQLPWLILQKAETTVMVPDRGTLMISGFKDILMRDLHSGVPFLENIPVLNFFFTRKGKASERRRLLLLVTPEIIDLSEREAERF